MTLKFTYLLALVFANLLATTSYSNNNDIQLLTQATQFEAGTPVILKFLNTTNQTPCLYVSNSYGTSIIKANNVAGSLNYVIPQFISNKTGVINWKLLSKKSLSGKVNILSKQKTASIETYLGPPSIEAGRTDYAMLVTIPTDAYDNPLANNTELSVKHQFLEKEIRDDVIVNHGIAYKNIFSPTKAGRILVSSECLNLNSKEYTINVMPAIPTNFSISYFRNHDYADGNQITNFSTSVIKDKFGNIISDGTYVEFFITNSSNYILKTAGTTINGVAHAKMIHPDHKEEWVIKAFVEGMAVSNTIKLAYKPIILDFEVLLSKNNRLITIGPLKSFMSQMVPDGLEVLLSIYVNDIKTQTLSKSTFEGYAKFKLDNNNFSTGNYTLKIKTAGIEKTYNNIKL